MFNELYSFLFFTAIGKCGRARDRACSNRRKRCSTSCCFLKGGKKWKEKKNTPLNRKEVVTNQPQKRKEIPPIPLFFFSAAHHRRAWVQVFQNWKFPTSVQKWIRGKMVAIWNEAGTRHHTEFRSNVFNFKETNEGEKPKFHVIRPACRIGHGSIQFYYMYNLNLPPLPLNGLPFPEGKYIQGRNA